jgi:hypothetical protein
MSKVLSPSFSAEASRPVLVRMSLPLSSSPVTRIVNTVMVCYIIYGPLIRQQAFKNILTPPRDDHTTHCLQLSLFQTQSQTSSTHILLARPAHMMHILLTHSCITHCTGSNSTSSSLRDRVDWDRLDINSRYDATTKATCCPFLQTPSSAGKVPVSRGI